MTKGQKKPAKRGLTKNYELYQCCKSDAEKNGEASECLLQVCQDVAALPRHTVVEQGEREAVEVAEAVLVWVVAVVPSALAVDPQMPLTCRQEGARFISSALRAVSVYTRDTDSLSTTDRGSPLSADGRPFLRFLTH